MLTKANARKLTKNQVVAMFKDHVLPHAPPCIPGRREAWHNYCDGLHKSGLISDHQVETWVAPAVCNRRRRACHC